VGKEGRCTDRLKDLLKVMPFERSQEKPTVVMYTCNPKTWEAEAGGFQVGDQLDYKVDPVSKNQKAKGLESSLIVAIRSMQALIRYRSNYIKHIKSNF
jgi:hypothetical protein